MADETAQEPVQQPSQPEQPVNQGKPEGLKGLALLEVGLFELLFIVGGLLIIFGLLNYYNVLPISRSIPFLSFLPQKQKIIENKTQEKTVVISEVELYKKIKNELPFSGCPIGPDLCKNAEIIQEESSQSAQWILRFSNIPQDSEILAALDGTLEIDNSTIILTNKGRLLKAYYEFEKDSFESQASSSAIVKQGEVLGKITSASDFDFYLKNTTSNSYVQVKPSPDGRSLLYAGL
ncbi:MAG: hypothetical protein HYT08_04485 [Candidatus Levybacteria bacterium]|nr:hypothetical protein [Candidatus Levybacteria bacterium]